MVQYLYITGLSVVLYIKEVGKMYILLILLSLILPLTLLFIGLIFYKHPPKEINSISGYRTTRSMKNIETWNEANKYSSKLIIRFSLPMVFITVFAIFLSGKSYEAIAIVILLSVVLCIALLIASIVMTEKHLKNMFDNRN